MYLITWHNAKATVIVIEEERLDLFCSCQPCVRSTYAHSAPSLCLRTQFLFPPDLLVTLRIFHSSDVFLLTGVEGGNLHSRLWSSTYWPIDHKRL